MSVRLVGLVGGILLASVAAAQLLVTGSANDGPVASAPGSADQPSGAPMVGRSQCPGALPVVKLAIDEGDVDTFEAIWAWAENVPGFLAVVDDGSGPVVVVERQSLNAWIARLAGNEIRAAPSCVPAGLLEAVQAALGGIELGEGGFSSAGYDVFADAVAVSSTLTESEMLAILEGRVAGAAKAHASGTLRVTTLPNGDFNRH